MSELAALQRRFMEAVYGEDEPGDAGLARYRLNALANLRGALADVHPVVRRLVGDAFFAEACARYARAHPSRSGDLHAFGARFGEFLERYPHAASLPYLGDVARLEWALHEAFHAADAGAFDFAALARVPEEDHARLVLRLHPAVRVLRPAHAALALWEANQPERDGVPDDDACVRPVLVYRDGFTVRAAALEEDEAAFLEALARREPLALAARAFEGRPAERLAEALARFARQGAIAGFELAGE